MPQFFTSLLSKLPSGTPTGVAFYVGFLVINFKLLVSGLTIHTYRMSDVSVSDWATGIAALAALYVSNKHIDNLQKNKQENNKQDTN